MSTNVERIPYKKALDAAMLLMEDFNPVCENIQIAGSIRRQKSDIGDIELVCIPKKEPSKQMSFFDEPKLEVSKAFRAMINKYYRIKGETTGRYLQLLISVKYPEGGEEICCNLKVDVFMPVAADFGRIFAIRTGPSDYSKNVLAVGWRKLGWVGTSDGLRRQSECIENVANKQWSCKTTNPTLPPFFETEPQFFEFLGIKWIEPKYRK